jgi:hypothetical protein
MYVSGEPFSSYSGISQEEFLLRYHPLSNRFLLRHLLSRHVRGATTPNPPQKKELLTPNLRIDEARWPVGGKVRGKQKQICIAASFKPGTE